FSTANLAVGSHAITAVYGGDSNFLASSGTLTETVNQAATTVAVSSSANSSVSGQAVTFTATVSISGPGSLAVANPTGVVIFSDGGTSIGQGALTTSGTTTASFSTSNLAVASHPILAFYSGDGNFLTSSATFTQTVNQAATTLAMASSANAAVAG